MNIRKEKKERSGSDLSIPPSSPPSPTYPQSNNLNKDNQSTHIVKHVLVGANTTDSSSSSSYVPPTINAVITISPRKGTTLYVLIN